jgi:hypothetical protein
LYTDAQIQAMLAESKPLPNDFGHRLVLKPKPGHKERELDVDGSSSTKYRLILRQANANPLDFSVILAVLVEQSTRVFRLRRYNGKSHEHTNKMERETFYDFHVHTATERYQAAGYVEDSFAVVSDRYGDFFEALDLMIAENGFVTPPNAQRLFS